MLKKLLQNTKSRALSFFQNLKRKIELEVCPTSNYAIANVPLPTKHPVHFWARKKGPIRVGTDDPAYLPCTIEGEYYSVDRSVNRK
jgi:adenosine deaminase